MYLATVLITLLHHTTRFSATLFGYLLLAVTALAATDVTSQTKFLAKRLLKPAVDMKTRSTRSSTGFCEVARKLGAINQAWCAACNLECLFTRARYLFEIQGLPLEFF